MLTERKTNLLQTFVRACSIQDLPAMETALMALIDQPRGSFAASERLIVLAQEELEEGNVQNAIDLLDKARITLVVSNLRKEYYEGRLAS